MVCGLSIVQFLFRLSLLSNSYTKLTLHQNIISLTYVFIIHFYFSSEAINCPTLTAFRMFKLFGRTTSRKSMITCKTLKQCMVGYRTFYALSNNVDRTDLGLFRSAAVCLHWCNCSFFCWWLFQQGGYIDKTSIYHKAFNVLSWFVK